MVLLMETSRPLEMSPAIFRILRAPLRWDVPIKLESILLAAWEDAVRIWIIWQKYLINESKERWTQHERTTNACPAKLQPL